MDRTQYTHSNRTAKGIAGALALLALTVVAGAGCSSRRGYPASNQSASNALAGISILESSHRMMLQDNANRLNEDALTANQHRMDNFNNEAYSDSSWTMTPMH